MKTWSLGCRYAALCLCGELCCLFLAFSLLRRNNPPKCGHKGFDGEGENAIRLGKPRPRIAQRDRWAVPVVGQRRITVGIFA